MQAAVLHLDTGRPRQICPGARRIVVNEVRPNGAPPSPAELIELVRAVARDQDRKAFARLFGYFAPRLKSFLVRSGLGTSLAEEVTQETMIAVWRRSSTFDPARAGVSTWIFSIARNQQIDRFRRIRSETVEGLIDPSDEPAAPVSGEDIVMSTEREQKVRKALEGLSSEQAKVVRLSFFADKPHPEIARELGIPLGTVKGRVRLALKRLQSLLDEDT